MAPDEDNRLIHDFRKSSLGLSTNGAPAGDKHVDELSFVPCAGMRDRSEALVSVDIEASGPSPSTGSLLSIGACLVDDLAVDFYVELKPNTEHEWDERAETIHGLSRERLLREGLSPVDAMTAFASWIERACGDREPIFVGFNAPFDWMFVADYLWRYI